MDEETGILRCACGAALEDYDGTLPQAGFLIAGGDYGDLLSKALAEFQVFLNATTAEARDAWLTRHFGLQWQRNFSDAQHLEALLHALVTNHSRPVYECQSCGRLMIDERTDNVIDLREYRPARDDMRLFKTPLWRPACT